MAQEIYPDIKSFSDDIHLSIDDSIYLHHVEVSMAISDNGIIFVGWKNSATHNGGGIRVSIVKSFDGGETWTSPYDMPMFEGRSTGQSDPWLFWYKDAIYYAYLEYENDADGLSQITVAKSDDDGESWTLVNATNAHYFADKETFVVGENNTIYVAYDDVDTSPTGNATVRVSRSLDGGYTYQDNSSLGEDFYFVGPYITLNQTGDVFIAWSWLPESGGNLYFTKSQDGGQKFDLPKLINHDGNYCVYETVGGYPSKATLPVLEFDQNKRLYVLWADKFDQQGDTWDVYLRYSDDFGRTWSDRIRVNPSMSGNQWNPDVAIDESGRLHIVYYSEQGGRYRPYYRTLN
ncbi:MAG: sialidase family protein, partial [Promethearchaeota archaeon]